jgi:hypothetical protein
MQYTEGLRVADPDKVRTIFLVFFTVFEPLRLLAAYHGNLSEKVLLGIKSSVKSPMSGGSPEHTIVPTFKVKCNQTPCS